MPSTSDFAAVNPGAPASGEGVSRPRVVCHMFTSLDGRIDGPYMFDKASAPSREAYGALRDTFGADAVVYGSTTMAGFLGRETPALPPVSPAEPDPLDYVAPQGTMPETAAAADSHDASHPATLWCVSLDPAGTLAFREPSLVRAGRPSMPVIQVLSEAASPAYRAYLRSCGVSYITAGTNSQALDLELACRKLAQLFCISCLLVCGGGLTDASFLEANLLDTLSVVVAPVASGEQGVATLFDLRQGQGALPPRPFTLASATPVAGNGVHLLYRRS